MTLMQLAGFLEARNLANDDFMEHQEMIAAAVEAQRAEREDALDASVAEGYWKRVGKKRLTGAAAGAVLVGGAAVAAPSAIGLMIGLTTVGPQAGGWFATWQAAGLLSGGGLTASLLAGNESLVMGGTGMAAAMVGGVSGAFIGAKSASVRVKK